MKVITSEKVELYQGVPQGTILGPLRFNIHVIDMRQNIAPILQYADDTMLYPANEDLEQSLTHISQYFRKNKLNLNADKTEFIPYVKNY